MTVVSNKKETELWDILDKNGEKTGKTVERSRGCLSKGEYHLVVHIWILGSDGRVLIQRRSLDKPLMPGEWAATGGAAVSGEDSLTAAQRELCEEVGIALEKDDFLLVKRIPRRNSLLDIYFVRCNVAASELRLQTEEVSEVCWVHRNKLKQMIKSGEYHNYGEEYFEILFDAFKKISLANKKRRNRRINGK